MQRSAHLSVTAVIQSGMNSEIILNIIYMSGMIPYILICPDIIMKSYYQPAYLKNRLIFMENALPVPVHRNSFPAEKMEKSILKGRQPSSIYRNLAVYDLQIDSLL
jgi:hypothetical protein